MTYLQSYIQVWISFELLQRVKQKFPGNIWSYTSNLLLAICFAATVKLVFTRDLKWINGSQVLVASISLLNLCLY